MALKSVGVVLHGDTCKLSQTFFPALDLDPDVPYGVALLGIYTYNSFPNVVKGVNDAVRFPHFREQCMFETGVYELETILKGIQDYLEIQLKRDTERAGTKPPPDRNKYKIKHYLDPGTSRLVITSGFEIDFNHPGSMYKLFGFHKDTIIKANIPTTAPKPAQIQSYTNLNVSLNVARGLYFNESRSNVIYSFVPDVDPFYRVTINIANPIYYQLNTSKIDFLELRLENEEGVLMENQGEELTAVIHITQM